MALPAALQALFDRLQTYNSDAYNASTNPGGFARGGNQKPVDNFIKSVRDFTAFGKGISDLVSSASADAITAAQEAAKAKAERIAAQEAASNAASSAQGAATDAGRAKTQADLAASYAAGVKLPAITSANAFQFLRVKADGSGYETFDLPPILPITMTAPASGATDVGAGGTYTFVARAFAGDTTGFYSNYGVPVALRFVNVYEPGGTNPVKTFTAAGGAPSLVANFTGSGLANSKAYQFEFGYTDAQGNTVKSPKVSATTASQFKPSEGQAYQGGFLAFQNFGDGDLFDLVVASKSTEASRAWSVAANNTTNSAFSRTNGSGNVAKTAETNTSGANGYATSITIGGVAGYLGAIDELRAISSKLKPSVAVEAAFKAGGAQVYDSVSSWSSTETTASNAMSTTMVNGGFSEDGKTTSYLVRAIKRVSTIAPYPIGTAMEGGTLAAYFTDLSSGSPVTYMLIVADKATEVTRAWDTGGTGAIGGSALSRTNGKTITEDPYVTARSGFLAYNYCGNLVSGGKSDWYLGAIDEMLAIARMQSQLPSGQQFSPATVNAYWSATELDASNGIGFRIDSGVPSEQNRAKSSAVIVRPIRRVLLPAT